MILRRHRFLIFQDAPDISDMSLVSMSTSMAMRALLMASSSTHFWLTCWGVRKTMQATNIRIRSTLRMPKIKRVAIPMLHSSLRGLVIILDGCIIRSCSRGNKLQKTCKCVWDNIDTSDCHFESICACTFAVFPIYRYCFPVELAGPTNGWGFFRLLK